MNSFKQFAQDKGFDWGTDKAANHASDITPGQQRTTRNYKPLTKHYIEIMGKRKRIAK